jgi:DNA-binding transcriptional ArsR family regulator
MQATLDALADPRRRRILELVRADEMAAGEIAGHFADVTRPAISQHLKVLKNADLLAERRDGTKRLYRAKADGLLGVRTFLDQFWDDRLERLRDAAERAERQSR